MEPSWRHEANSHHWSIIVLSAVWGLRRLRIKAAAVVHPSSPTLEASARPSLWQLPQLKPFQSMKGVKNRNGSNMVVSKTHAEEERKQSGSSSICKVSCIIGILKSRSIVLQLGYTFKRNKGYLYRPAPAGSSAQPRYNPNISDMNYYIIMWTSRFVTAVYICKQVALSTSNAFSVSC